MGKADEDVISIIEEGEQEELWGLIGFPASVVLVVPEDDDRPQFCPEDFVVFYEYPFRNGFKFPFSPLTRQIFRDVRLHSWTANATCMANLLRPGGCND